MNSEKIAITRKRVFVTGEAWNQAYREINVNFQMKCEI